MKKGLIITSIILAVLLIGSLIFNFTYNFAGNVTWNNKQFSDAREVMNYIGENKNNKITFIGNYGEYTYEFKELGILENLSGSSVYPELTSLGKKNFFGILLGKKVNYEPDVNYSTHKFEKKLNEDIIPNEQKEKIDTTYEVDKSTGTINIKNGHKGCEIDTEELIKILKEEIKNFEKDIVIEIPIKETDFEKIDVVKLNEETRVEPINMEIVDDGETKKIIYAENGIGLNADARNVIYDSQEKEDLEYTVALTVEEPEIKNIDLSELFKATLGEYTTYYGSKDAGRTANVEISANFINNIVLNPGDEFSYTDLVGPTTADKGYKEANVFVNGKVERGLGGGICQTSSTLYVAVLNASLQITERHNHSLFVSYVPKAFDATVATGILDFKFKNNYNFPIKISAIGKNGTLTIKILGEEKLKDIKLYNKFISSSGDYETWALYKDVIVNGEVVESGVKVNTSSYKK